jgi:hypothetical protein
MHDNRVKKKPVSFCSIHPLLQYLGYPDLCVLFVFDVELMQNGLNGRKRNCNDFYRKLLVLQGRTSICLNQNFHTPRRGEINKSPKA